MPRDCVVERIRFQVQVRAADPANQVVVIMPGQLIGQVTTSDLGGMDNAVPGQEIQRSINGGLCHTDRVDALINLSGRKVPALMQGLQNGQTLGRHAIAACPQGLSVFGYARQGETPYCNYYQ